MKKKKPILCLDFDGVIHSYESGWQGPRNITDLPVPGALEFIVSAIEHFQIHIFSSRSRYFGGRWAMKRWLKSQYVEISGIDQRDRWHIPRSNLEIPEWWFNWISQTVFADPWDDEIDWAIKRLFTQIKFPTKKPSAFLILDDRAYTFRGAFPNPKTLLNFKPWNKKEVSDNRDGV